MAAVWPTPGEPGPFVGALSLQRDAELDLDELGRSLEVLDPSVRPVRLTVLDSLPVTGGFRPLKSLIRAQADQSTAEVVYDSQADRYRWGAAATSAEEGPRSA
jgi:hypothetical protein